MRMAHQTLDSKRNSKESLINYSSGFDLDTAQACSKAGPHLRQFPAGDWKLQLTPSPLGHMQIAGWLHPSKPAHVRGCKVMHLLISGIAMELVPTMAQASSNSSTWSNAMRRIWWQRLKAFGFLLVEVLCKVMPAKTHDKTTQSDWANISLLPASVVHDQVHHMVTPCHQLCCAVTHSKWPGQNQVRNWNKYELWWARCWGPRTRIAGEIASHRHWEKIYLGQTS